MLKLELNGITFSGYYFVNKDDLNMNFMSKLFPFYFILHSVIILI